VTRRPVILAVDDTPGNLVALEAVLERDFDVRLSRSGAEAISLLEQRPDVDVILMDVNMPAMDGYEAASQITRLAGCGDIPIVFITATYKEDPYIKRGYEVGGIDYFTKPFDPDLLRKKIGVYAMFHQRAALLATTKQLSVTLEHAAVGVVITDLAGQLQQANDAVAGILGTGWREADAHVITSVDQALDRALHDGESSAGMVRFKGREIQTSVCPLRDPDGRISGAVITVRDLSELHRLERELEPRTAGRT
jgi:PAS domain S-box-containing protein